MLWPVRIVLKLILKLRVVVVSVLVGMAIAFYLQLREQQQQWGVVPADRERSLAGDDLVPDAGIVDTRTLTIDAPASRVWPWLVQMGYERGGWYSYDAMDMKGSSAEQVLSEFQDLAVGDVVPTHAGGGFVVRELVPRKALVLYLDSELVHQQAEAAAGGADTAEGSTPGLQVSGVLGGMAMPEFRASWAFVLEPEAGGRRTRLLERLRVEAPEGGLTQKLGLPVFGMGVFAMTRKHMLGLKERAEGEGAGPGHEKPDAEEQPARAQEPAAAEASTDVSAEPQPSQA
jgi:hypothetical protein